MTGSLVIGGQLGNYLIESVIGRGGMSVVYRATHFRLGTPVALKALAPELSSDDAFRERFLREAKMAAGIDHPNVIPIYDTGLHEDSLYIIMRFVGGGDLKAELDASGPLSVGRTIELLAPVARALDVAHARGLVHRDVKPANILLQRSADGEVEHVYLSDFGVMKHTASISGLTKTGALVGSIDYMAPEQIEGKPVSAQTDVYALGCLLYQCVTGRVPFERESEAAALWAHMREDVEPATDLRPELPAAIDDVIGRALAKNPAVRFETCEELIGASSAAASEPEPGAARSPSAAAAPPTSKPAGRQSGRDGGVRIGRRLQVAGLTVLVGGAIAAVVALTSGGSSSKGDRFPAALLGVPTNHVAGTGDAVVKLSGNTAVITVDTNDLLGAAPHAMHIHAGGLGKCPTAEAAHEHNHRMAISTVNGEPFYGPPVTSITTSGDTTTKSILAFPRYPHAGNIRYTRTFSLPSDVATQVRNRKASIVVHGIDYNSNGIYDAVLDRSELDRRLPGEATAPALCGPLVPADTTSADGGGTQVYTASLALMPANVDSRPAMPHH
jgi:protein kinase-like protein